MLDPTELEWKPPGIAAAKGAAARTQANAVTESAHLRAFQGKKSGKTRIKDHLRTADPEIACLPHRSWHDRRKLFVQL